MEAVITYTMYLTISVAFTIWVANTLSKNGRRFLIDAFGEEELADSVNHLLVVGFYLINFGYISWALKLGFRPVDQAQVVEALSEKVGHVLMVLGAMHFSNLYVFTQIRKSRSMRRPTTPVSPTMTAR